MKKFAGLYSLFMKRLKEIKTKNGLISFPSVFEKICATFSISKEDCWEILFLLKEVGFIEIVAGHGIRIKNKEFIKVKEGKLIRAENIPRNCINKCKDCGKDFEAEITIKETCDECFKAFEKRTDEIEKKLKEEDQNIRLADWQYKLIAMAMACEEMKKNGKNMH